MKDWLLLPANLHLFEGGDGAGAAAPADGGTQGDTQASADNTQPRKNDLSKVKYGKQTSDTDASNPAAAAGADTTGVVPTSDTLEARQKEFDELINSDKFKDIYTQRTQAMIDRRFGQTKAVEAENTKLREIADMLGQKYGITDDADFSKLKSAIESDDDTWLQAAEEAGMTVEQYKKFNAVQKRAAAYDAAKQNDIKAAQQRQLAEKWMTEAQALKAKFPQFDLRVELADRNFVAAINAGVPMEIVYKGKYYDQNLTESSDSAAKAAEKRTLDNVRARGARPAENGASPQSASFTVKSDPSKLTLADFDEIARRVRNGEQISF